MSNFVESSVGIQNFVMIMMEICLAFEMMLILLSVTRFEGLKRITLTVTLLNDIGDQFMFGPSFMVSPVYRYGDRSREIYFPQAEGWYDFYSGKFQAGGERKVIEAPYERIPLYVRAGAIIPFGDDIQYTDEKPAEHIRLYIYQGADGEFTLYEDEGVNYNYEQGMYAMIPMKYDEATKTLVIGERQGEFPGMLKERTFTVVTVNKEKAQPFDLNAKGVTVKYNGSEQTLKL